MSSLVEVKHSAPESAVRKKVNNSHALKGVLRVKLSLNTEIEKDKNGYSLTNMEANCYHMAYGSTLKIRSFKVVYKDKVIKKASMFLMLGDCISYVQSISLDDFRGLFHAFKPEVVNDELNLLSTSEEEVIATGTDQVPMAGTNNA